MAIESASVPRIVPATRSIMDATADWMAALAHLEPADAAVEARRMARYFAMVADSYEELLQPVDTTPSARFL